MSKWGSNKELLLKYYKVCFNFIYLVIWDKHLPKLVYISILSHFIIYSQENICMNNNTLKYLIYAKNVWTGSQNTSSCRYCVYYMVPHILMPKTPVSLLSLLAHGICSGWVYLANCSIEWLHVQYIWEAYKGNCAPVYLCQSDIHRLWLDNKYWVANPQQSIFVI